MAGYTDRDCDLSLIHISLGCLTEEGFVESGKPGKQEQKQMDRKEREEPVFRVRIPEKKRHGRYLLVTLPARCV